MSPADGKLDETAIMELRNMMTRAPARAVMSVYKAKRRIEFSLPEGHETSDKVLAGMLNDGLRVLDGSLPSIIDPERFVEMRTLAPQ